MNKQEINKIIAENLTYLMDKSGKTQLDLADYMGVSQATVSNWCKGIKLPRMDKIDRICDFFNITRSQLMESAEDSFDGYCLSHAVRIPVLGSVPAGIPLEAIEDIEDWEEIPREWTSGGKEYFGLKIQGDSMFPKYMEGDTIILRKEDDCESGDECVVYVNGYDATFKKVIKKTDHIILQPLNSSYEPIMIDYNDEHNPIKIVGVVVELRRKL